MTWKKLQPLEEQSSRSGSSRSSRSSRRSRRSRRSSRSSSSSSSRSRNLWTQDAKSLLNLRPQKFYELRANHVACFANASGGEALRPPPQTPLQPGSGWVLKFFFQGIKFFFQGLVGVKPSNFFPGVVIFFSRAYPGVHLTLDHKGLCFTLLTKHLLASSTLMGSFSPIEVGVKWRRFQWPPRIVALVCVEWGG